MNAKGIAGGALGFLSGYTVGTKTCLSLAVAGWTCSPLGALVFGIIGAFAGMFVGGSSPDRISATVRAGRLQAPA